MIPAVGGLLVIHAILATTSASRKCAVFDEVAHLTKGYSYWITDDYRMTPSHPPLAQAWAALPLLNNQLKFPSRDQPAWHESHPIKIGKQFFYRLGNDSIAMLREARFMITLMSLALGVIVFLWSRQLFGLTGGFISLGLYTFSPTVLAHARLVTTDMCVSLFFMATLTGLWWTLHRLSIASLLLSAAALGGLFLAKFSAVLILPMGLALLLIRLIVGRPWIVKLGRQWQLVSRVKMTMLAFGIVAFYLFSVWIMIWSAFGFRYEMMADPEPGRDVFFAGQPIPADQTAWEFQARGIPHHGRLVNWTRHRRLLPETYLYGYLCAMQYSRGRDAFLDGQRSLTGWRHFFPLCFLYKVPLAIMGMLVLAAGVFVIGATGRPKLPGLYSAAPLLVLICVYWCFAVAATLNIGHRHLLPTFAPLFVLCGVVASRRRWMWLIVAGLLGLLVVTSLRIWPHYLAYFNTIAGGPSQGYRHLVDSSLDWGQDLPALEQWLRDNHRDEKVYVAYFGTGAWRRRPVPIEPLPSSLSSTGEGDYRLEAGLYCISATRLQQVYGLKPTQWTEHQEQQYRRLLPEMQQFERNPNQQVVRNEPDFRSRFNTFQKLRFGRLCAWLRQREPDDFAGYSILIYRLTGEDIDQALARN